MIKDIFDRVMALFALIVLAPVMALSFLLILIFLGRPVIFKQIRPGLHGKPFYLYKFRSMTNEQNAEGQLLPDEVRLTRFGKLLRRLSLDEIPQLINVVKGELSLVGPRPLLMEYLSLYSPEQARRNEVKPGITGWAQILGRNAITWEEKFKLDLWYVDHRSFLLDLKILCITLLRVLRQEGINQTGYATMPFFKGTKDNADDRV